nr:helix-turn-helix transcriptional regulator [uncultured Butyricicoccus sp.]
MRGLKKIRAEANMTQVELAKKLNVSQASVSAWESNLEVYPREDIVIRIADLFGCSIDELFGRGKEV